VVPKWCKHIGWSLNLGWVFDDVDEVIENIDKSWKYCPRCGKKRPKTKEVPFNVLPSFRV